MKQSRRSWLKSSVAASAGLFPMTHWNFSTPGPITGPILLNSNENPWGPSPKALAAITAASREANRYPWETRQLLIEKISQLEGIPSDFIMLGAGSTELLQLAAMAFASQGKTVATCYPTFPVLMQQSRAFSGNWKKIDLDAGLQQNTEAMIAAAQEVQLLYFCNPNNPIGNMLARKDVENLCQHVPQSTMILIDEAYMELTEGGLENSVVSLVLKNPNVMVARTFSKVYGLAGMRVGYLYANPSLIEQLKKYHIGFEINIPIISLHAALAALEDQNYVKHCKKENARMVQKISTAFDSWDVRYIPSKTNFIYFENRKFRENLVSELEKRQIYIRDYSDQPGYARVSMGTEEQVDFFLKTIKQFLV